MSRECSALSPTTAHKTSDYCQCPRTGQADVALDMAMVEIATIRASVSSEIERQGCELDPHGIALWLSTNGIMPASADLLGYVDQSPWRLGGETAVCWASARYVTDARTIERGFVLKSLVGLLPHLQERTWRERRSLLHSMGIPVSQWYSCSSAMIVEPHYPFGRDSFAQLDVLPELARIAALLDAHGFAPIDYIDDLRSDGDTLYYVDFGFDLGSPSSAPKSLAHRTLTKFCGANALAFPVEAYRSALSETRIQ